MTIAITTNLPGTWSYTWTADAPTVGQTGAGSGTGTSFTKYRNAWWQIVVDFSDVQPGGVTYGITCIVNPTASG